MTFHGTDTHRNINAPIKMCRRSQEYMSQHELASES